MQKIKVFMKRPGDPPFSTWISNTLQNLQRNVGGPIEVVRMPGNLIIICNEEGKITGELPNCLFGGEVFAGTIIFAGVDGEEFCDVPMEWKDFKKDFGWLFDKKLNEEIAYDTV